MGKDTRELLEALETCEEFKDYYSENIDDLQTGSLSDEFSALLKKYGCKRADVIRDAQVSQIYGYQIISGARRPERPKLLRLLIATHANLQEIQNVLKHCGYSQLYVKNPADCVVIYGICHHLSVLEINEMLFEYDLELI